MPDKRRALLTDSERAVLLGEKEVSDNHYYTIVSRIRSKFEELEKDMEALHEHEDLLREMRDVVCEN